MTTDTSEKGLEALIVAHMTGISARPAEPVGFADEPEPLYPPGELADAGTPGRSRTPKLFSPYFCAMVAPVRGR